MTVDTYLSCQGLGILYAKNNPGFVYKLHSRLVEKSNLENEEEMGRHWVSKNNCIQGNEQWVGVCRERQKVKQNRKSLGEVNGREKIPWDKGDRGQVGRKEDGWEKSREGCQGFFLRKIWNFLGPQHNMTAWSTCHIQTTTPCLLVPAFCRALCGWMLPGHFYL